MRILKYSLSFLFILLISVVAFSPFLILNSALPDEAWLVSAAGEMSRSFSLVPRLDGAILGNQNPLMVMLYSLSSGDLHASRLATIVLGLVMGVSLMMFAGYMWNLKTGVISALLALTSLGMISVFGKTNPSALPVLLSAVSFMIFSAVYMKGLARFLYVPAYILAVASAITGGPVYLFFFLISTVLLVLLDLSPGEFLKAKPLAAVILLAGGLLAVCIVFWIAGGRIFMKGAVSQGSDMGFFKSIWLVFKSGLPWIPLLIPAWVYSARPSEFARWRELLPAKVAFVSCLMVAWLSGRCPDAFTVLAVPFASVMMASLISGGEFERSGKTGFAAMIAAVAFVFFIPVSYILMFPFKSLHPNLFDAAAAAGIAVCCLIALGATIKKRSAIAFVVMVVAVLGMSWLRPFYEARLNNPADMMSYCAAQRPLLVFDDDLVMRGGLASVQPGVVGRCFVPVGHEAYIAVSTSNTGKLMKDIRKSMSAELKSKQVLDRDYLLIRVWPKDLIAD